MLNILIIHNEESMCSIFTKILEPRGFNIVCAKNGNEGLRFSEKQDFDLVFLASSLDDIDGVRVLGLLKRQKRDLPVVLCCGMHELDAAVEAVKDGAYDFIEEPYKNSEILRVSREILKKTGKGKDEAGDLLEHEYLKDSARKKLPKIIGIVLSVLVVIAVAVDIAIISNKNKSKKPEITAEPVKSVEEDKEPVINKIKQEVPVKKTEIAPVFAVKKPEPEKLLKAVVSDRVYNVQYTHPSGMFRSVEYLYVCDWFSQSIYKHRVDDNLTLVKTYSAGDLHPSGLAIINEYLWVSDSWDGTVTKFRIENELVPVKTYKVKEQSPAGLIFDGANLWLCDTAAKKINKHWMDNELTLNTSYNSPAESPVALFWDGRNVWSGDRDSGIVFNHRSSVTMDDYDKYQNETQKAKRGKFSAFAGDRDSFWLAFDGTGSIYRFEAGKFKGR